MRRSPSTRSTRRATAPRVSSSGAGRNRTRQASMPASTARSAATRSEIDGRPADAATDPRPAMRGRAPRAGEASAQDGGGHRRVWRMLGRSRYRRRPPADRRAAGPTKESIRAKARDHRLRRPARHHRGRLLRRWHRLPGPTEAASGAAPRAPRPARVTIVDFGFQPADLTRRRRHDGHLDQYRRCDAHGQVERRHARERPA